MNVTLSNHWAAAYNSDIPLASLVLYPHLLLVILSILSISMEYMISCAKSTLDSNKAYKNIYFVSIDVIRA